MNILITGANGFLGSYLYSNLKSLNLIKFNRDDPNEIDWRNIDGVIHCAGLAHNSHNKNMWKLYKEANINLTNYLKSQFIDSNASFFIFISTTTIYENIHQEEEINETDIGSKLSIYAKSKIEAEDSLLSVSEKKIFILRPSIIVGPNPKGNLKTLEKLITRNIPLFIPKRSGILEVTDIRNIQYIIEYLIKMHSETDSGIYNVTDTTKPNIKELIIKLAKKHNRTPRIIQIPNMVFNWLLKILTLFNSKYKSKLENVFFNKKRISTKKILQLTDLPFNSYE